MPLRCEPGSEPIPGFRLVERLGGGGFGEIWKCRTPEGAFRAIKIVHGDLAAAGDRTAELELHGLRRIADIHHPFVLTMERIDVLDGQLLIVMELADGSLWDRFHSCRGEGRPGIPRDELLRYVADAAEGLDTLRDAQLQHLDVKPQNLLLVEDRVKVSDFGLVRDLRSGRPGVGASPAYSAPETIAGALSPHCDQYSLAIVYQELLTGTRPFTGTTPEQLARQHLTEAPNLSLLPATDREVVGRALSKKPTARFSSCADFIRALRDPPDFGFRLSDFGLENRKSGIHGPQSTIQPTVVMGIGGVGGAVLRQLRRSLAEQDRQRDRRPIRLLYIDADPQAARDAIENGDFDPSEVLPTKLQRADHYAKLRFDPTKSAPISWLDSDLLDNLAAAPTPQGCRGLGRLAFADHIRALGQKIEADLAAVARTNSTGKPRAIIIAGLAGGTGSGMVIDLAFLTRYLLRNFGDTSAVSGWLLSPANENDEGAAANVVAALMELRYFSRPDTTYRARCDYPVDSLTTRDAPFRDLVALPLDDAGIENATQGLLRELMTPTDHSATAPGECRTFSQIRFVWPRHAILRTAARRLAAELIERWSSAEATAIAGPVRTWVAEQWTALELGPEALAKRLQNVAAAAIGRPFEQAIKAIVGPVTLLRPEAVPAAVARIDELFARIEPTLLAASDGLAREWGTRLARPAVTLIEQSDFRLAGAEAAVRILAERIERTLAHIGSAADELRRKADDARSADPSAAARQRFQGLIMRQVAAIYGVLRSQIADQLAEIGLCRTRLAAVSAALRAEGQDEKPTSGLLLPPDCSTAADAANQIEIGADDLRELDRAVQRHLSDTAGGLARTCLTNEDLSQSLGPVLINLADSVLASRLGADCAAELFLARHPGDEANRTLRAAWQNAVPVMASDQQAEITSVVAPESIEELARKEFGSDVPFLPGHDEIVVRRTVSRLPLADLRQLGKTARAIYQRRNSAGDSLHSRADIISWQKD
jgi:eukaryotic-like serine/threonine-protein kinase